MPYWIDVSLLSQLIAYIRKHKIEPLASAFRSHQLSLGGLHYCVDEGGVGG